MKNIIILFASIFIIGLPFEHLYSQQPVLNGSSKLNIMDKLVQKERRIYDLKFIKVQSRRNELQNRLHQNKSQHGSAEVIYKNSNFYPIQNKRFPKNVLIKYLANALNEYFLDTVTAFSTDSERYIYSYDGNGNMLTDHFQVWNSGYWRDSTLDSYTYDANGNILSLETESWNGSQLVNNMLDLYSYDINGNEFTDLNQIWDGSQWVSNWLNTYTYDAKGNEISGLEQDFYNNVWENDYLDSIKYDKNGNLISDLEKYWDTNQWVNEFINSYAYDSNGNDISFLVQVWDNDKWINQRKDSYTYDENGKLLSWLEQNWNNNQWLNYYYDLLTYDMNEYLIKELVVSYDGTGVANDSLYSFSVNDAKGNNITWTAHQWRYGRWENWERDTVTYDENENPILYEHQELENSIWVLSLGDSTLDYYGINNGGDFFQGYMVTFVWESKDINSVKKEGYFPSNYSLSQNYPNPFNPSTTIKYSIPKSNFVTLKVFDVLGKVVATLVNGEKLQGNYEINFNGKNLSSGVYFYRLEAGSFMETKKFLLLK